MPQVPVYGGTQVRTAPLQPVQQGQIDVSSGMRVASQALGQVAGEIDKVVQRDAQDEAFKLEAQLRNDWNQHRAKLRENYKGDQADQYKAAADEWWKEAPQKYGSGVNPLARRLASRSLESFRLQADADTLGYVEGEKKRARSTNYQMLQQSLIQDALTSVTPATAAAIGDDVSKRITENAIKFATAEGIPDAGPVMAKEQLIKYHSNVALSLAGRPGGADAAKAYLSQFGGSMEADDRARVLDLVDTEAEKAKTKVVRDMSGTLMLGIERGQFPRRAQIDELAKIDPTAAAAVERALGAEIKARKAEAKGSKPETDWAVYEQVRAKIASGTLDVPVSTFRDRIAPGEIEKLIDFKTKRDDPKKAPEVATTEQQIGAFTKQMELKGEKLGQFQSAAYDLFNEHLKAKGKEPTFDERQAILDGLVKEIVIKPGWLWDTKGPAYQAPRETRNAAMQPDKFTAGKVYTDAAGNRAKYLGAGKWEPVK